MVKQNSLFFLGVSVLSVVKNFFQVLMKKRGIKFLTTETPRKMREEEIDLSA